MAIIKKVQIRPEGGNDYETILYPETSADMVKIEGTSGTLRDHINDDNRHMTPAEKTKLANLQNYTHPTGAGWRHIPTGGSDGNFLSWAGNGNAKWGSGLLEKIGENVLSNNETQVVVSSLSSYRVVKVFIRGRASSSGSSGSVSVYLNNNTGDNYFWTEIVAGSGSLQAKIESTGIPNGIFLGTTSVDGYLELTLLNSPNSSSGPSYFITGSRNDYNSHVKMIWGRFTRNEVVDQIRFSGSFRAGSMIMVYGGK